MNEALRGISSMATKHVLAELAQAYSRDRHPVRIASMGGVDAAAKIRAGEPCDFVVLAADAIAKLEAEGHVQAASRVDIARCGIAVAVAADSAPPDLSTEASVRDAVTSARAVGYSTGPSGAHLLRLFERWGIQPRLVQAPPGVGVGELIQRGDVTLGFQQLSELIHLDGIRLVGPLPPDIQSMTTFSAGVCATSAHRGEARALLQFLSSSVTDECKRRHGMEPMQ